MTEQTYECSEIPVFSVIHENSKMFKQDCFNLRETSMACQMVENVCNIGVFDSRWLVFTNYCI